MPISLSPDRRRVLGGLLAAGATLTWTEGGWAQAPQGGTPPRRGGILRIAAPDSPDSLDPQASFSGVGWQASALIYDNLTGLDERDQPVPELATRWSESNGAREWLFELRQGVKFHHGRELTSEDVVATFTRVLDRSLGLNAYGALGPLERVVAEGPHAVRFILSQPFAELPVTLAGEFGRVLAADRIATLRTEPVGTGPFRFGEFQPGTSFSVTRNAEYWKPGQPYLDGVRLVNIRDAIAQQAALRAGAVDVITRLPPESILVLRRTPGVQVQVRATGSYHCIVSQGTSPPFDNPKVREAFKYIVDRDALMQAAWFGLGGMGNDVPLLPGNAYLPELPQHRQDLAKAKALLEESGVGPITVDLYTTSERPPAPKLALAFAEAAGRVGVTIRVRDVPYTEYSANVLRKRPLYTSSIGGSPTLFQAVYRVHKRGLPTNYGNEGTPELDALLERMIAEPDLERRKDVVAEVLRHTHSFGERMIPYFTPYLAATSAKVNGFTPPLYNVVDVRPIWLAP